MASLASDYLAAGLTMPNERANSPPRPDAGRPAKTTISALQGGLLLART
jgi:hypothetical protein